MGDHTSTGPEATGTAEAGDPAGQSLQPERAFVVQLRGGPVSNRSSLQGRVEHVVSGEALRFRSTAELIAFLTQPGHSPGAAQSLEARSPAEPERRPR